MKNNKKTDKKEIFSTALHSVPLDVQKVISVSPALKKAWEEGTLLARNEWICWITSAKKAETRSHRIKRMIKELVEGKRRPCCWPGCAHR